MPCVAEVAPKILLRLVCTFRNRHLYFFDFFFHFVVNVNLVVDIQPVVLDGEPSRLVPSQSKLSLSSLKMGIPTNLVQNS